MTLKKILAGNWLRAGIVCLSLVSLRSMAQTQELTKLERAQRFEMLKSYDSAAVLYGQLYQAEGANMYLPYYNALIESKKYKEAEKLAQGEIGRQGTSYIPEVDLGRVYKLQGKDKKATEQFDAALSRINGDDLLTQRTVKAFTDAGQPDYAIKTYQAAINKLGNPFFYGLQLATLYATNNQLDKAMEVVLAGAPGQYFQTDNVKALFLQWIGNDPKKLQVAQKFLLKRINEEPGNNHLAHLLTWIYTQKDDWDGALIQMEAVDERNNETGNTLMDFAHTAREAGKYSIAYRAYDDVIAKGTDKPLYSAARKEKVTAQLDELEKAPEYKPEAVSALMAEYGQLMAAYPQYYGTDAASDYAMLAARYADSLDKAISILETALKSPDTRVKAAGNFKLQLGDYYMMKGKVWDASLIYSQVDKDFKQDALGEDARFRNAKLHYYRGDFDWAQSMLTVLKRSTSENIANDALFLSVQITENVEDSNYYPLARFAHAAMLLEQNKDKQAEALLDSITIAFPKHPLADDIIMEHAHIAIKHRQYDRAITLLTEVAQKYADDVLADDAIFRIAELYNNTLNKKDSAKEYYEKLIIDFPGSTFVQTARQRLQEINNPALPQ